MIGRLNVGLHCKLTLNSAPAGFGKTTLLSEWVAAGADSASDPQNQNRRPSRPAKDRQF
jgi:ATP/maltotriose-dependent transcriptional regulator MalT